MPNTMWGRVFQNGGTRKLGKSMSLVQEIWAWAGCIKREAWGIPLLENTKLTKCSFHGFFDRYEINIQDFEDFYGDLHNFPVSVFDFSKFQNVKDPKVQNSKV